MKRLVAPAIVWMLYTSLLYAANERINQEGRILGPLPAVTNAILFNTTNADAVVSAMQILPVTNPWNECISNRPVLSNSDAMIAQIMSDLSASRRTLIAFQEMNFVLAPDHQPLVSLDFVDYPDDSDLNGGTYPYGLYPIPTNMPIEGWPTQTGGQTLSQWQTNNDGSDRHSIIVQPGAGFSFGDVERVAGGHKLAGGQRRDIQSEHERAAAGGLDLGRRGGFSDVPGAGALSMKPSAAWWSTRAASWSNGRGITPTFIRPRIMPRRRATRARTCRRWASGCG